MTGTEIAQKALLLLGYSDTQGSVATEQRLKARALTVINTVYADLYFHSNYEIEFRPLRSMNDKIPLNERILNDIMPYGVAAYFAITESDGSSQQVFASLYNSKHAAGLKPQSIKDTLPAVSF